MQSLLQCSSNIVIGILSVCVIVLFIRHSIRKRRNVVLSIACLAPPCFSTLSHKYDFCKKKNIVHTVLVCVLIYPHVLSEIVSSLIRIKQDVISIHASSCKVPVILVRF